MSIFPKDLLSRFRTRCMVLPAGKPGDIVLRECLRNGMPMGTQLERLVDEVSGDTTVVLSQRARPPEGYDLTSETCIRGGAPSIRGYGILAWIDRWVRQSLTGASDRVFVSEDAMGQRHHPFMAKPQPPVLFVGDNLYWFLTPDDRSNVERIRIHFCDLDIWGAIGILTSWPLNTPIADRLDITPSTLNELVARTQNIVVSAYDGDGFLIWYRGGWHGKTRRWGVF